MAPRMPESVQQFETRFRAAAARGDTEIRFGLHHYSHAIVREGDTWSVRPLELDRAKADAYRAEHKMFMPEHAEMLSEPGPTAVFAGTLDQVIAKLPSIWPR